MPVWCVSKRVLIFMVSSDQGSGWHCSSHVDHSQEYKGHESPPVSLHQPGVGPRYQAVCRKVPSDCVTGEPSGRECAELPTTAAGGEGQSCDSYGLVGQSCGSHVTCGVVMC